MFFDILDWISIIIGILGIFVIVWGVILTFAKFLMKEFSRGFPQ